MSATTTKIRAPNPPRGLFTHGRRCRSDWSVGHLLFVTYWREFHFYWCHRMIHPWFKKGSPLKPLDIGQFLYTHFHSLHHKSYNPGPWSGLSMHPVEHFFYYSCTLLPLFFKAHPLHHLYAKFHADIAPIAGHDGMKFSGGDFHWLHHAKYGPTALKNGGDHPCCAVFDRCGTGTRSFGAAFRIRDG